MKQMVVCLRSTEFAETSLRKKVYFITSFLSQNKCASYRTGIDLYTFTLYSFHNVERSDYIVEWSEVVMKQLKEVS